jgi:hypothetical protein
MVIAIVASLFALGSVAHSPSRNAAPAAMTHAVGVPLLHHCAPHAYQKFVNRLSAVPGPHVGNVLLSAGGASSAADATEHGTFVSCDAVLAAGMPVALTFIAVHQYRRTSAHTHVGRSPVPVTRVPRALTVFQLAMLRT